MASTSSVKIFAYSLHILCTLIALVLISFGTYVLVSYETNEIGATVAYAYIAIGVAGIVIVFWGYLAAWREHVCCTVTFITFLYLIIIVQLMAVFLLTQKADSAASNLANVVDTTMEKELDTPGAMSLYENWFHCCGRGSPQDYIVDGRLPPATCFRDHDNSKAENLIHQGCRVEFENYWLQLLKIFNIIGWVLVAAELVLSVISCSLCSSIRNDNRRSYS
ncbi:Tsp42Ef, partial [Drosophila busckii]